MFKYVIDNLDNVIIGSRGLKHTSLARGLEGTPISAGFLTFTDKEEDNFLPGDINAKAYGESLTLNLTSRKEDSNIIQHIINSY